MAKFQVMVAPGYFDNAVLHPPGTILEIGPEDAHHVSLSFKPLDSEAEGIIARRRKEDPASADAFRTLLAENDKAVELKPISPLKVSTSFPDAEKKATPLRK